MRGSVASERGRVVNINDLGRGGGAAAIRWHRHLTDGRCLFMNIHSIMHTQSGRQLRAAMTAPTVVSFSACGE